MAYNQILKRRIIGTITKGGKEVQLSAATETSHWWRPDFAVEAIKVPFEQAVQQSPTPLPDGTIEVCARDVETLKETSSKG